MTDQEIDQLVLHEQREDEKYHDRFLETEAEYEEMIEAEERENSFDESDYCWNETDQRYERV